MKTELKKGQILDSGFEILEVKELAEFEAGGIWARHTKSGAQVFHVYNDDRENLFAFAFATAPEDSTGAAHILEHSVLCGSENYPLKDAFLVLAQGSLQTFLNAWTFPDKTVYPASSVNEHDYFNLMGVYGDAVFRPLISEWTFMQEGCRLEFAPGPAGEKLTLTGVVYNEMKGAYSSLDAYAGLWSVKAVLPGTPYDFDSGGDPDHIPRLSREKLLEFHRSRYSPANCRIFLAGNIPTEKQLAFLNDKFLSSLAGGKAAPPVSPAARWKEKRSFRVPCPASGAEGKATVLVSWLCGDASDAVETLCLAALTETLLGHDGSPLTRALVDSGLGEDLSPVTGLEGEIRETVFCAGLRGVRGGGVHEVRGLRGVREGSGGEESYKKVEALILGELERLVREGIPEKEIEAALLSMEFSHREIRRSGGPFSLVWMRRSLRSWLHGGAPWDSLLFDPAFAELKKRLAGNKRYFEDLIRRYMLDNPHRAFIVIEPEKDFLEKKDAEREAFLREKEKALGEGEKKALKEKAAALVRFQEEGDSPEALAAIPHLTRKDLSPDIEKINREFFDAAGVPVIAHSLFTNGISYADLAFPVDLLEDDDYFWLPFFSRAAVSVGLPGMDYGEVSGLLTRTTGGFHAMLETGSMVPGASRAAVLPQGIFDIRGRDWLIFRLKALDEKMAPSLDLALRLIIEGDFGDLKRIRDLAVELKNDMDSNLAPSGHSFASSRSGRGFSHSRRIDEKWNGLEQLFFVHRLAETEAGEISGRLCSLREKISGNGLVINLGGSGEAIKNCLGEIGKRFGSFGPPRPRRETAARAPEGGGEPEVFASSSLQVGFAALTLPASPYDSAEQAAELVLSHQLSTGPLWEAIRMKGGAYGAFTHPDSIEGAFSFSTYRDPDPLRSLETFPALLKELAGGGTTGGEEELVKAVIGTYARETHPRTAAEKSLLDFCRFLYGVEDSHRSRRLKSVIAVREAETAAVLRRLASLAEGPGSPVIITGRAQAEKAAARLNCEVKELPV
jgi:Zn-dependent M16 (insulinase) family peptidase